MATRQKLLAVLFVILIVAVGSFSTVFSQESEFLEEIGSGQWLPTKSFVNMTIDEETMDGNVSFRFSLENRSGYLDFGYVFDIPQNLSGTALLVLDIMIFNVSIQIPCSMVFDDTNGNKRGFWDLVENFDLDPMTRATIVVDSSIFEWENSGFDPANVTRIRFVSYNDGANYSQTVWVSSLKLFVDAGSGLHEADIDPNLRLIIGILLVSIVCSLMGSLTLRAIGVRIPSGVNSPLMLPIYFAFGSACLVLVLMPLALVYIDFTIVTGIFLFLIGILLFFYRNKIETTRLNIRYWTRTSFLLPLVLLGLSFGRFAYLALDMGWAPILDPETHGMYVGLILHHNHIPSTTYPVGNQSINLIEYPLGFHVVGASISMTSGLYPGLAILAVATAIVMFFPSLLFSTVYVGTRSIKLSLIAYLLTYFLPTIVPVQWQVSNDLLLGTFLPGTYPNLFGNMIFLSFLAVTLSFDNNRNSSFKKPLVVYVVLASALAIVYFPLLPFAVLFILLRILTRRMQMGISVYRLFEISVVFVFLLMSWWLLLLRGRSYAETINLDSSFFFKYYMRYPLFALSPYLVYTIFIFLSLAILGLFLFGVRFQKLNNLSVMFLLLFFPLMLAQKKEIYTNLLWFIAPDRVLILLVASSYVVTLVGVAEILERRKRVFVFNKKYMKVLLICGAVLLFSPSLVGHVTYSYPPHLKSELPRGDDFVVMEWLAKNVDPNDLILNDFTHRAAWIPSFKAQNVVNDRRILLDLYLFGSINGTWLANRTVECNNIIIHPWDYGSVKEASSHYGLKYVYISEDDPRVGMYTRGRRYSPAFPWNGFSQEQRIAFYLLNPYLEVAHRSGNSVVFKVVGLSRES